MCRARYGWGIEIGIGIEKGHKKRKRSISLLIRSRFLKLGKVRVISVTDCFDSVNIWSSSQSYFLFVKSHGQNPRKRNLKKTQLITRIQTWWKDWVSSEMKRQVIYQIFMHSGNIALLKNIGISLYVFPNLSSVLRQFQFQPVLWKKTQWKKGDFRNSLLAVTDNLWIMKENCDIVLLKLLAYGWIEGVFPWSSLNCKRQFNRDFWQ